MAVLITMQLYAALPNEVICSIWLCCCVSYVVLLDKTMFCESQNVLQTAHESDLFFIACVFIEMLHYEASSIKRSISEASFVFVSQMFSQAG